MEVLGGPIVIAGEAPPRFGTTRVKGRKLENRR